MKSAAGVQGLPCEVIVHARQALHSRCNSRFALAGPSNFKKSLAIFCRINTPRRGDCLTRYIGNW